MYLKKYSESGWFSMFTKPNFFFCCHNWRQFKICHGEKSCHFDKVLKNSRHANVDMIQLPFVLQTKWKFCIMCVLLKSTNTFVRGFFIGKKQLWMHLYTIVCLIDLKKCIFDNIFRCKYTGNSNWYN